MGIDEVINLLQSLGVPGFLIVFVWLTWTFVPKGIEAYKTAKKEAQEAFDRRQEEYRVQSEKIIAVATAANIAIERATAAIEKNIEVAQAAINGFDVFGKTLENFKGNFTDLDRQTSEININMHKLLEHSRLD